MDEARERAILEDLVAKQAVPSYVGEDSLRGTAHRLRLIPASTVVRVQTQDTEALLEHFAHLGEVKERGATSIAVVMTTKAGWSTRHVVVSTQIEAAEVGAQLSMRAAALEGWLNQRASERALHALVVGLERAFK